MSVDWSAVFGIGASPLELVVRGTAMYLFLFLLFRVIIGRGERHHEEMKRLRPCEARLQAADPSRKSYSRPASITAAIMLRTAPSEGDLLA